MVAIDDNDEKLLNKIRDNEDGLFIVTNVNNNNSKAVEYRIPKNNILLYGEVDLDNDDDLDFFFKYKSKLIADDVMGRKNIIRSEFDYETGIVPIVNVNKVLLRDTWDLETWLKYNHLLLGKPNKILIYECK